MKILVLYEFNVVYRQNKTHVSTYGMTPSMTCHGAAAQSVQLFATHALSLRLGGFRHRSRPDSYSVLSKPE